MNKKIFILLFGAVLLLAILPYLHATLDNESLVALSSQYANGYPYANCGAGTSYRGMQITPLINNVAIVNVTLYGLETATTAYVYVNGTPSTGTLLGSASFSGVTATFSNPISLTNGYNYLIAVNNGGSSYQQCYASGGGFTAPPGLPGNWINWTGTFDGNNMQVGAPEDFISIMLQNTSTPTQLNLTLPANQSNIIVTGTNFVVNYTNASININNATWNNATYFIWFNNGTLWNSTNINLGNLSTTTSSVSFGNFPVANFTWNVKGFYSNSTKTNSTWATNGNFTFNTSNQIFNYNLTAYETSNQQFALTLITNGYAPSNYSLNYANKFYAAALSSGGSNTYNISSSLDVPIGIASNNFYFSWNNGTAQVNSSTLQQNVSNISLAYCIGGSPYINFSFQDELNQTVLNATTPTSTFNYWLGGGSIFKTLSYSNSTQNYNYPFCFLPSNQTISMNYSISYNAPSYATRTNVIGNMLFSNAITNIILYLLQIPSGQIVTFQVVNSATQPLIGVNGTATKVINGSSTIVGSGISGQDGGISFFVDPLTQYTFAFNLAGYNPFTETIFPTQTGYTITLGSSSGNQSDYTRGISQSISPPVQTLNNGTFYLFNYSISSAYWALQNFSFNLYGSNGTLIGSNSSSSQTGGSITFNGSVLNYSYVRMNYFYYINNTIVNSTVAWDVFNNVGTGFSLANFFSDFTADVNSGMFGLDSFSAALIIYIIIFYVTGFISWKFSLQNPGIIMGIMTSLVIFFDWVLGFDGFLNPIGAIPYFPSALMLFMTIGFIIRETTR
jgi:hypothetical protein